MREPSAIPAVFTLTTITGRRKSEDREKVIATVEVNQRLANTTAVGLIPSIAIGGLCSLIIGIWAVFVAAAVMFAWLFLVYRRSRHGLGLRTLDAMVDRRRSLAGKFIQCGVVIEPSHYEPFQVMAATAEVHRPPEADFLDAFNQDPAPGEQAPVVSAGKTRRMLREERAEPVLDETNSLVDLIT